MTFIGSTRNPLRVGRKAMVATSNPLVTAIGIGVLREGGNAVDAAVAMGFALAVAEPQNSHLGGDVFLQYWNAPGRELYAVNGAGAAPSGATPDALGDPKSPDKSTGRATATPEGLPLRGLRSATVPGAVDGWLTALRRWGTWSPKQAVAPAIALAEDGYGLTNWQVEQWLRLADVISGHPHMSATFSLRPLAVGAIMTQPVLAGTLRQIADGGRKAFYAGPFAEKLLSYSERKGGFFTREDLEQHRSQIPDPILTTYRGYTVTEQPLVSQGLLVLEMLNILEPHDLSRVDPESADAIHLMAEATKLAFADRNAYLGDDASAPVTQLLSKSHAERQRRRINSHAAASRFTPTRLRSAAGADTTCVCVIDPSGSGVVMIQSICHAFGSGVVVPDTGVVLGNRMSAFSLDPASPNMLQPGKMPLNTLNTYMMFRGDDLWAMGGTPGGDVQIQTNLQVITQMIDNGRNPQQAIESPKWHISDDGPGLSIEERMPLDTCYELRTLGHQLSIGESWSAPGGSQCIVVDPETGSLLGATDPRIDGLALGY